MKAKTTGRRLFSCVISTITKTFVNAAKRSQNSTDSSSSSNFTKRPSELRKKVTEGFPVHFLARFPRRYLDSLSAARCWSDHLAERAPCSGGISHYCEGIWYYLDPGTSLRLPVGVTWTEQLRIAPYTPVRQLQIQVSSGTPTTYS